MPDSRPSQPNSLAAFGLGLAGFLAFAGLSLIVVGVFRGEGGEFDAALDQKRLGWKAASDAAQEPYLTAGWVDEAAGTARVAPSDFLEIAAADLARNARPPRPMQGDAFIVPGTPTFEAMAARQAAEAAAGSATQARPEEADAGAPDPDGGSQPAPQEDQPEPAPSAPPQG